MGVSDDSDAKNSYKKRGFQGSKPHILALIFLSPFPHFFDAWFAVTFAWQALYFNATWGMKPSEYFIKAMFAIPFLAN